MMTLMFLYPDPNLSLSSIWSRERLISLGFEALSGLGSPDWDNVSFDGGQVFAGISGTRFGTQVAEFYAAGQPYEGLHALVKLALTQMEQLPGEVILLNHDAEMSGPVLTYFKDGLNPKIFFPGVLGNIETGVRQKRWLLRDLLQPLQEWLAEAKGFDVEFTEFGEYYEFDFNWEGSRYFPFEAGQYDCCLPWPDENDPTIPAGGYFFRG